MQQPKHRKTLLSATVATAMLAALATAPKMHAAEMSRGEMAAAIRSADYPCAQVTALKSAGDNAWSVQCNSGKFHVSRDQDGSFTVTQTE